MDVWDKVKKIRMQAEEQEGRERVMRMGCVRAKIRKEGNGRQEGARWLLHDGEMKGEWHEWRKEYRRRETEYRSKGERLLVGRREGWGRATGKCGERERGRVA